MSQHDLDIDNQLAAAFRADLNNALVAMSTLQSGSSAPPTTYPLMWWADDGTGFLKQRNAADTAWVTVMPLATLMAKDSDLASVHSSGTGWVKYRNGELFQYGTQAITTTPTNYNFPIAFIAAPRSTVGSVLMGAAAFDNTAINHQSASQFRAASQTTSTTITWNSIGRWA